MTESSRSKRRLLKQAPTVRQQAEKAGEARAAQPRRLQATTQRVSTPFRVVGRQIAKLARFKVVRIVGYVVLPPYVRNSFKELRHVTWLTFRQSLRLTWAVTAFAIVFGVVIAIVDYGLDKIFKEVLLK